LNSWKEGDLLDVRVPVGIGHYVVKYEGEGKDPYTFKGTIVESANEQYPVGYYWHLWFSNAFQKRG